MDGNIKNKLKIITLISSIGALPLFLSFFVLFIVVLFILGIFDGGSSSSIGNSGYTVTCDNKAAEMVAKILYTEQGGTDDFFIKLTTAAIIINNAGGTSYSDIQTLTKNNYSAIERARNNSFNDLIPASKQGEMLYISELVLSGSYNLPKNIIFQTGIESTINNYGHLWQKYDTKPYPTYFGYSGDSLSSTTITGETLPSEAYGDSSVDYYKNLASSLEKEDYSTYTLSSICITGCESVTNEYNFENTTVTVMDGRNEVILATVSLEDYIIGVSCIEIGTCGGGASKRNENYIKSQFVASKTYVLARGKYNSTTKSITIRASTRDQGWCDLEKGCYTTKDGDFSNFYYGGYNGQAATKKFTEDDLIILHKYYKETYGELFLPTSKNGSIMSLSSSEGTSYKSKTQNFWSWAASKGYNYGEILKATANPTSIGYTEKVSDTSSYKNKYLYKFSESCSSSYNGTLQTLANYPNGKKGLNILDKNIYTTLGNDKVEELNNYIRSNVDAAGYGTGAAVAAAGQSLAYGLYQHGYYLGYCWGGDRSSVGIGKSWGNRVSSCNSPTNTHKYYGMDCSGFVSWAIRNGCNSSYSSNVAAGYAKLGTSISLKDAKPGDLLANSGHVILIVKNNGDGSVITVEEGGSDDGLVFHTKTTKGKYSVRDMSGWYSKNCKSSR